MTRKERDAEALAEDFTTISHYTVSCAASADYGGKLGYGAAQHSLTWIDDGIIVQFKMEALVVSILMEEYANIGLLEDYLDTLRSILKPFSTANFVTTNV